MEGDFTKKACCGRTFGHSPNCAHYSASERARQDRSELAGLREAAAKPIDMLIFCPECGMQHIDRPDAPNSKCPSCDSPQPNLHPAVQYEGEVQPCKDPFHNGRWTNPPHKSHTCRKEDGGCGIIFRVADVPTNGVEKIQTRGKADTWPEVVG